MATPAPPATFSVLYRAPADCKPRKNTGRDPAALGAGVIAAPRRLHPGPADVRTPARSPRDPGTFVRGEPEGFGAAASGEGPRRFVTASGSGRSRPADWPARGGGPSAGAALPVPPAGLPRRSSPPAEAGSGRPRSSRTGPHGVAPVVRPAAARSPTSPRRRLAHGRDEADGSQEGPSWRGRPGSPASQPRAGSSAGARAETGGLRAAHPAPRSEARDEPCPFVSDRKARGAARNADAPAEASGDQ